MARDADFPQKVIEVLAKRSGYRCSFPGCRQRTIGPSAEGPMSTSSTGEAAHIIAASTGTGARRASAGSLSIAQLASIENGIWMCSYHARLIDRDEATFTVQMLRQWRAVAERKASLSQQLGREVDFGTHDRAGIALSDCVIDIVGLTSENEQIGDALLYSGVHEIWGEQLARSVRDLTIELARNTF